MKKISYILLFMLVGIALTGCKDYLTPDNKTAANQTADDVFSSDPSVLRTYAYSKMKDVVKYTQLYEDGVDLYMPANKKSASDYDQYTFNVEDDNVKGLYSACYSVINMANCCIYYDENGKYTAEMHWLRDYCYYILMQQFGGVPYITEYINNSSTEYPRENLLDLYKKVSDDLAAIAKSSTLADSSKDGYVSKQAANALLAKVCLAAGWDAERANKTDIASSYFDKATKAANNVTKGITLNLKFEDKWSPSNEQNEEVIFAVQYDRAGWKGETKTGGHGLQNTFGSYYGDCTSTGQKYSDSYRCINPKASYLWESGDERWNGTFMTTMYNCKKGEWGNVGYFAYYNADQTAKDTMKIAQVFFPGTATASEISAYKSKHASQLEKGEYFNEYYFITMTYPQIQCNSGKEDYVTFVNHGSTSGMNSAPSVKKFDDPQSECIALNKTNDFRDIVLLHMSDIFLVQAEAYLKLNNQDSALFFINAVRARSGAGAISAFADYKPAWNKLTIYQSFAVQPIDLILDERARELFAEGHRWMDLHRTGQLERYNKAFNAYLNGKTVKNYRPIPQAEINANSAMTQNEQNSEWR